jgi:hypothetical protein
MRRWFWGVLATGFLVVLLPLFHSAAQSASSSGRTFSADRGYWAMVNGRLEKWDFHRDGTFLHEGVMASVGVAVRNGDRGTYRIKGDKLVLQIGSTAMAFTTGGEHSAAGGTAGTAVRTVTMTIRLIGKDGADGVVLNGKKFGIRHGW